MPWAAVLLRKLFLLLFNMMADMGLCLQCRQELNSVFFLLPSDLLVVTKQAGTLLLLLLLDGYNPWLISLGWCRSVGLRVTAQEAQGACGAWGAGSAAVAAAELRGRLQPSSWCS